MLDLSDLLHFSHIFLIGLTPTPAGPLGGV